MGVTKKGLHYCDNAEELYEIALINYKNNPSDANEEDVFHRFIDYERSLGIEKY